jgi:flavin-dependent dehydrogenase
MNRPLVVPTERIHDVVVVGAGPAGSITALALARGGASVLLVDKSTFPRPKVCGCCVNPRALETLHRSGQGQLTARLGVVPLTSLTLGCDGRHATIRHPLGVAVSREAFDLALVTAACEHGVAFHPETTASLLPAASSEFRELRLRRDGRSWSVRGRFVVSATGLTDSLREDDGTRSSQRLDSDHRPAPGSKIGAGTIAPRVPEGYTLGQIFMACAGDGYVGLVAIEDGRLNIAAALRPAAVRHSGGIGPLVERILAEAQFPEVPGVAQLLWKGTPGLTRTARNVEENLVFRVGDAAGYIEPFTGEGIAWALSGGSMLARLLGDSLGTAHRSLERTWADAYRREVTRTQHVCRAASLALRTPWLTRSIVRILSVYPRLASPLIRSIHEPRSSTPGRWPEGLDFS